MAGAELAIQKFRSVMREIVREIRDEGDQAFLRKEFQKLDADGNGVVSLGELAAHPAASQMEPGTLRNLMRLLDADGNGQLDFEECCALFFLCLPFRLCDACKTCIKHHYYVTCVDCDLKKDDKSFNLCLECFSSSTFSHEHPCFLPPQFIWAMRKSETAEAKPHRHAHEKAKDKGRKVEEKNSFHEFVKNLSDIANIAQVASMCSLQ